MGRIRKGDATGGGGSMKEMEVDVVLRWLERDIALVAAETAEEVACVNADAH